MVIRQGKERKTTDCYNLTDAAKGVSSERSNTERENCPRHEGSPSRKINDRRLAGKLVAALKST